MNEAIIYLVFLIVGFVMGRVGQKPAAGMEKAERKEIKVPNPLQAYRDHKEREEEKKILKRLEIINENLDNYDGTGANQKDVI